MNNLEIIKLEHVFKTLGNRKRLALLVYLLGGESSINQMSKALNIPYKTADRNLLQLQESGFLNKHTSYNQTFFSINYSAKNEYVLLLNIIRKSAREDDLKELAKSMLTTARNMNKVYRHIKAKYSPM